MRGDQNKRLTILSEAEKIALYGLPDFDDFQRIDYLAMTDIEHALAFARKGMAAQLHCLLQLGYFKAKNAFFNFSLNDAPAEDIAFLMQRYFPGQALPIQQISDNDRYRPRNEIAALFGFRLWSNEDLPVLLNKAILLARTDVSPTFLLAELMVFLIGQRIVRPGYTTLQDLITNALTTERERLGLLVESALTDAAREAMQQLLVRENTLSDLAALKQDAKGFRYRQMGLERQKRLTLAPLYGYAKALLPKLEISQINIAYYASLANFYTIYDLRRLKPGQTHLYLLCYAWQRYRQLTDNLVEAFGYHTRHLEDDTKAVANKQATQIHNERQQATPRVGELLLLYVDDTLADVTPFGTVRQRAFRIIPEEKLRSTGKLLAEKPVSQLDTQWRAFDEELCSGKLKHLEFDSVRQTLTWHRPKADKDKLLQQSFYAKLQAHDIADVFRFVNEKSGFLSAMTPLQPRYAKKIADEDSLMAVIFAQAMNHGNFSMAETCDIPYHVLEATHQQYLRPATLIHANNQISNFIASLPIFPYYSIDMDVLYGSVDGQKFAAANPTLKARHSRKYFGKDRGVVAFTLLANHVALQTELLGANQHESYWVFDICYNNTSDIVPTTITGDMHSINMANFAILYWFGMNLAPRFTNLQALLKHLYCGPGQGGYADFLIQPVGQIDRSLITSEKANMDHIAATLGLKEMSQSVLMRKICTLSGHHRTRKAIFEFDKLIRSIYTLRYLRDPQLQRDVHRSENRIESYHQLRSTIAQVNGKKELTGRTDLDVAISNHCGRLIANVVIAYNSMLLSGLLERCLATGNEKALDLLRRISPAAWQHLHFLGHYAFRDKRNPIDLESILAGVIFAL